MSVRVIRWNETEENIRIDEERHLGLGKIDIVSREIPGKGFDILLRQ